MHISKKWWAKAKNYKWFARNYTNADFSKKSAFAMYEYEYLGKGNVNHYNTIDGMVNGYALGKHLQDLQLAMWREDLNRPFMLTKYELFTDQNLIPIRKLLIEQFGDLTCLMNTGGMIDSVTFLPIDSHSDNSIVHNQTSKLIKDDLSKLISEYMY